jgi:hypothetical protein
MMFIRKYILLFFWRMAMTVHHATESLTIHHKVKDYPTWRKGYDEREKSRVAAGVTNGNVFRGAEDPSEVVIVQDVAEMGRARAWLMGEHLKTAMHEAGVIGPTRFHFSA